MNPKLRIAAITDEFSPDLEQSLVAMKSIGMTGAELRVIWGKNVMDLSDEELKRVRDLCHAAEIEVISIASPILKCVLPNAPEVDTRFQQDVFASKHSFEDQPRLTERAFAIATLLGARIVRVFSYWRTVAPEQVEERVIRALDGLAAQASSAGLTIGLENEHACNVGTAAESSRILSAVSHAHLQLVWDPANALVGGEEPFPYGYSLLPKNRVAHVHAKDCSMDGHKPVWGPLGTRKVDWKGQVAALIADGYTGWLSLETHWPGPGGNDKMAASTICGWNLRGLAAN
ncbi:MAG: sugar phosphate isomerase/epimerase [Bryobacteraceae bacterium]|nr:sugar phosphate isomerase/epimerase [Bryobacteraceae bacterium]